MAATNDVLGLFHGTKFYWAKVLRESATLALGDWEADGVALGKVLQGPKALASEIVRLSRETGATAEHLLRNAVAVAPIEEFGLVRLVVLALHQDGVLDEAHPWLSALPQPSKFEAFLAARLVGRFEPSPEAFIGLMAAIGDKSGPAVVVANIIQSIPSSGGSAKLFFEKMRQHGLPDTTPAAPLFVAIAARANSEPLIPDLDTEELAKLPQAWRQHILANPRHLQVLLLPAMIAGLATDPATFKDTSDGIHARQLLESLSKELAAGRLSGSLMASLFQKKSVCEAMERDFDWSVLGAVSSRIKLDWSKALTPSINEFRYRTDSGRFFANIATLALSGDTEILLPQRAADVIVARQLLAEADRAVLRFAIETSAGAAQLFILQSLISDEKDPAVKKFALDAYFGSSLDGRTDPRSLSFALSHASKDQCNQGFELAFAHPDICSALLAWNNEYASWFSDRLVAGVLPQYSASIEMFRIYNTLGKIGVRIVGSLLAHASALDLTQRDLVQRTLQHAPRHAADVFRKRSVHLQDFVDTILSTSFQKCSSDEQAAILRLSSRRGKSALQLAYESGRLTEEFLSWLEQKTDLRASIALTAPETLRQGSPPIVELLVGITRRPSRAAKLVADIDRASLVEALPQALCLLNDRPRTSAALELAVRSDISALPHFMRLAKKLAPPFEQSDLGRRYDDLYSVYEIPKRSGGVRTISAPAAHLKAAQRALLKLLYEEAISDQATGFVPGRSTKDNAARHVGKEIVVNADVRSFFPSTGYRRVYALARRLCQEQLTPLGARLFAEICCHDGHLATGAPTSPVVSNLILRDLDARLDKIACRVGVTYSRYADDLTFSGGSPSVWMLKPARTLLSRLGYELDPQKTNIFRKGRRQIVTGAVVNEKVNLARTLRRQLRAAVDHRVRGKQPTLNGKILNDAMLNGHLSYLKMLSPESAAPLIQRLRGAAGWHY